MHEIERLQIFPRDDLWRNVGGQVDLVGVRFLDTLQEQERATVQPELCRVVLVARILQGKQVALN